MSTPRLVPLLLLLSLLSCSRRERPQLRVGFSPNITHAQALVGNLDGTFERELGPEGVQLVPFNAGPQAMEALISGSLDASYVGPGPATNAHLRGGRRLRIIAGAASGGAVLVVRSANSAEELKGKKVAAPQVGNTQDIALRHWLKEQGVPTGPAAKGMVEVLALASSEALNLFRRRDIEGAWVPEPWGARLVAEGGARILVDERRLWPNGQFPTTVLVTTREELDKNPNRIAALLRAHVELTERWQAKPAAFAQQANEGFAKFTAKRLPPEVLADAFSRLEPTLDPLPDALAVAARHAKELGYANSDDVSNVIDTRLLEQVRSGALRGP